MNGKYTVNFDSIYNNNNKAPTPEDLKQLEECKKIREENLKYWNENAKEYPGVPGEAVVVKDTDNIWFKKFISNIEVKTYLQEHPSALVLYYNSICSCLSGSSGYVVYDDDKVIFEYVTRIS